MTIATQIKPAFRNEFKSKQASKNVVNNKGGGSALSGMSTRAGSSGTAPLGGSASTLLDEDSDSKTTSTFSLDFARGMEEDLVEGDFSELGELEFGPNLGR